VERGRDRFRHTEEHFWGIGRREKAFIKNFVDLDMQD
jgi:hypothetical protein